MANKKNSDLVNEADPNKEPVQAETLEVLPESASEAGDAAPVDDAAPQDILSPETETETETEPKVAAVDSVPTVDQSEKPADITISDVAEEVTSPLVIDDSLPLSNVAASVAEVAQLALPESHAEWLSVFHELPLQGLLKSIAAECVLLRAEFVSDAMVVTLLLNLSHAQLFNARQQEAMQQALQALS
ncbi:MAG: hypothetical protein HRU33_11625, partial [Rhodobacteraceae bacterium]|nr:hypothetical protein [Paracoccaceae bacterium]